MLPGYIDLRSNGEFSGLCIELLPNLALSLDVTHEILL